MSYTRNYKLSDKQIYAILRLCEMKSGSMPVASNLPTGAIGKGRRPVINLQTALSLDDWGLARINSYFTRVTIKPFVRQLIEQGVEIQRRKISDLKEF